MADNQGLKAVSFLRLIIGDKNDNPMESGSSEIYVYNYMGRAPTTEIGRVYVDDPDDWDLPDKSFFFKESVLFILIKFYNWIYNFKLYILQFFESFNKDRLN